MKTYTIEIEGNVVEYKPMTRGLRKMLMEMEDLRAKAKPTKAEKQRTAKLFDDFIEGSVLNPDVADNLSSPEGETTLFEAILRLSEGVSEQAEKN